MNRCALAHRLWLLSCRRANSRFKAALRDPHGAQQNILLKIIHENQNTQIGRRLGFDKIDSIQKFQSSVPICTYDELEDKINQILVGDQNVLTRQRVTHLIPTSGSSGSVKLIPYTGGLQKQFNAAIAPWMVDLHSNWPQLKRGQSYWSISPASEPQRAAVSAVPIGFEDDTAYLGGIARRLANAVMAVPNSVRHIQDIDEFRYATLWWLVPARNLSLVSVWHPSFWTLLLEYLPACWDRLLSDLSNGTCTLNSGQIRYRMEGKCRSLEKIFQCSPTDWNALWPNLKLISAWGDAAARPALSSLKQSFPGVHLQPKGIISTEAFLSLPFRGKHPAALTSHFIELLGEDGQCIELKDGQIGESYQPVITTAGGLYRYRTGDEIRIVDKLDNCPTFQLVGRLNKTMDICGEKLTEAFVQHVLDKVFEASCLNPAFAMLTPLHSSGPTCYKLLLDQTAYSQCSPNLLAKQVDDALRKNPHYDYARKLGQLGALTIQKVSQRAHSHYLQHCPRQSGALGAVKPTILGKFSELDDEY